MPADLSERLADAVTPGLDPGGHLFKKKDGMVGQVRP
jgi:hypothetical protein